ncbi:restriction endonuclease subunit S [Klebsiella grimontii]|uniref:restriction endonuclease subunit S n=1 Tax=Klebsiella TaxID=570 RepID=UPI000BF0D2E0|nr:MULTISPECIES: restriction endonuclease subunit S [Klebsiella]PEN21519.1 restriction endonuclease [Klebsiella sp. MBT K-1]
MAVEKLIVDHIDTWTTARQTRSTAGRGSSGKIDLYGIKKLRELILELAVRGKLVPQDPNDEPASVLLERIAAEKAELVKQGKIKKQKPLPEISEEEKPFELPVGWEWVTLATVGEIVGGGTPKSDNPQYWAKNGIKWLTPADLYGLKGKYISSGSRDISPEGLSNSSARLMPKGSVLFSSRAPIGYVAIADAELSTNQGFKSCVPYIKESAEYIYYFLMASAKKIDAEASGTTFKEVSGAIVSKILFPLPPLSEQLKIVSRANELMSLCDQLEQHSLTSLDAHQQLVETLLTTLTDSQNADELAENWAHISEHFDTLFSTEASIDALKQTILQLAVMGKLVPQDPNDEPASELLKRIALEKAQLVKDGKMKKQKPLPPISDEEKLFELPEGWEWCRLEEIAYIFSGNAFKSEDFNESAGTKCIKITNVGVHEFIESQDYLPSDFNKSYHNFRVYSGDMIIAMTRPYISSGLKICICPDSYHNALLNQRVCAIRLSHFSEYYYLFLKSLFVLKHYQDRFNNSGLQPNLKMADISHLLIPVPPENEQNKIQNKINALYTMIETLLELTKSAQQTQLHLADALTDTAIN